MSTTTTYYRTGQGSHRHASATCANVRRSLHTGDVVEIPAEQVGDWTPCEFCCDAAEITASAAEQAAKSAEFCAYTVPVSGTYKIRRGTPTPGSCACGATNVAINRGSVTLRQHRPA